MIFSWKGQGLSRTRASLLVYMTACIRSNIHSHTHSNLKGSPKNFNCSDEVNMAGSVRGPSLSRTARENEQTLVSEAPENDYVIGPCRRVILWSRLDFYDKRLHNLYQMKTCICSSVCDFFSICFQTILPSFRITERTLSVVNDCVFFSRTFFHFQDQKHIHTPLCFPKLQLTSIQLFFC